MIRRLCLCLLTGLLLHSTVLAGAVNVDQSGVAIDGFDPVAYHTDGRPVPGDAGIVFEWNGATWRFATEDHRDRFAEAPERFAPRYGGFCAWAVSQGKLAPIDPEAWSIVDDRLYLNYSARIRKRWEKRSAEFIESADRRWPKLSDED